MEYTGKIVYIGEIETVGQNNLEKLTFVLEEDTDREYKGGIAIDLLKDKTNLISKFKVGDTVTAYLNFRANFSEKTKKYYNSTQARRIDGDKTEVKHDNFAEGIPF